jgi:hypothetical protein
MCRYKRQTAYPSLRKLNEGEWGAFEYYHKEALGVHYFAKVKDGSGYMYLINILEESGSTIQNFFKGYVQNFIDSKFKSEDIISINDEN